VQASAQQAGIKLDVGEFPDTGTDSASDPERPTRITAHAIARVADRIPFSRKISRHLEGTDARAGILSDVLALFVEIARRNPEIIEHGVEDLMSNASQARANRARAQTKPATPDGGEPNDQR
jgi:hypothetical protein